MKVFNIHNIYIVYKNKTYTKIDQKVFSGHLVVCWPWLLMWSVRTSHLCFSNTYTDETHVLSFMLIENKLVDDH